jgi:hypothetical protein
MRAVLLVASALSTAACFHPAVTRTDSTLLTPEGIDLDFELQVPSAQSVFVVAEHAESIGGIEAPIWIEVIGRDPDDHGFGIHFCAPGMPELYPYPVEPGSCVFVARIDYHPEPGGPSETFRVVVHNEGPSAPVRLRVIHSPSRNPDRIRVRRGPLISN